MKKLIILGMCSALVLFAVGCCTKAPQEVNEAQTALDSAKAKCAEEYVASDYDKAKDLLREAESYANEKKCKESRNKALEAIKLARKAEEKAVEEMKKAEMEAEAAIAEAEEAIEEAKKAGAPEHASSTYNKAVSKLEEAKKLARAGDCNYLKVKELADSAKMLAERAVKEAEAEKARIAEQKRLEALARKKAEEEAMKWNNWTVEKGDTLWAISSHEKIYADPFMWPLIWKANRSQVRDPDLIYPEQEFSIPRDYSKEDAKDAANYSKTRYEIWPAPDFLTDGK